MTDHDADAADPGPLCAGCGVPLDLDREHQECRDCVREVGGQ